MGSKMEQQNSIVIINNDDRGLMNFRKELIIELLSKK